MMPAINENHGGYETLVNQVKSTVLTTVTLN